MASDCEQLSRELSLLRIEISRIRTMTAGEVKTIVEQTLNPQVQLITYKLDAATTTATSALNKANSFESTLRQMNSVIAGSVTVARNAEGTASKSLAEALKSARQAELAQGLSVQAKSEAISASSKSGTAISKAVSAERVASEATSGVVEVRATTNSLRGGVSQAIRDAGNASRVAVDTAAEITGVKGTVKAFSGLISKVESTAAAALVNAAKAVGISEQALGKVLGLVGTVANLFNTIATIFTLLEQLAVLETLGARIDAVENAVQALGSDLSRLLGRLVGIQNRLGSVEYKLPLIEDIASSAILIGRSAESIARNALQSAGIARQDAQQAQTTADGAVRNATQANDNATTAFRKASDAQGIAEQAKQIGGQALQKAGEALTTALTAIALYQSVKALRGLQGIPGIPGRNGTNGINGIPGRQGDRGFQGLPGTPGRDGITTVVQVPGVPGRQGERGFPGINGSPGRNGQNGIPGRDGRNGTDVNPAEAASLRALIIQQHNQTRLNSTSQHTATRTRILTPIMAALAPIIALLKQIYDIVSKAAVGAQLALLNIINSKLGNQVTGGISGLITSIAQNSYLDKVLTVLTFAATIHNALMLSNNLGQTLISIIDQVLGFILPKGLDGNPINFSSVLGKAVHQVIADAIGEENYTEIKEDWQKANRIYQATSNVFNQVTALGGLITTGLEVVGGNVGKIGNALRKGGVLLENAYGYMNPQPNLQGKFFTFLNTAGEKAAAIAAVVALPIAMKEVLAGINSSSAELRREISQTDPKDEQGNPIRDDKGQIVHYKPGFEVPIPIVEQAKGEQAKADSTNFLELVIEDIFDGGD